MSGREHWATRLGLILAMAGNAVGFGNFLRFPVQAASNGGGAFMIPYFVALLLLGLPLMWVEWALGRFGGVRSHGTTPGMFELIWRSRAAKYFGLLGVALPLFVVMYYVYIESWTMAYCFLSAAGAFAGMRPAEFGPFFDNLLGGAGYWPIYLFFLLTVLANFAVMWGGIAGGIEKLAKVALPLLFVFAIVLVVRVLTLGSPDPAHPERSVWNGMGFLWNPDLSKLSHMKIWLAAAGQVFFTLSLGFGVIACYASYLRKKDDVALSGLTTAATNEFAEVILGGSIAIPLAFAFLGAAAVTQISEAGPFALAFVTMPIIFSGPQLPFGQLLSVLWFLLLLLAGITSSVALAQPVAAFVEDEFGWSRQKTLIVIWSVILAGANLVVFAPGVMGEMDFWAGTFGIVVFALIEVVIFVWVFGPDRAWAQINQSADIRIPRAIYYVLTYITPLYLAGLVVAWFIQSGWSGVLMSEIAGPEKPWRWAARAMMLLVLAGLAYLIHRSRHLREDESGGVAPDVG